MMISISATPAEDPWESKKIGSILYQSLKSSGAEVSISVFSVAQGRNQVNIDSLEVPESLRRSGVGTSLALKALRKALTHKPFAVHVLVKTDDTGVDKVAQKFWQAVVHRTPGRDGIIILKPLEVSKIVGATK